MPTISSKNYVKIDSNKIKALAKENGISIQKMSVSLGRSHDYLREVMLRGTMHGPSLDLLCKLYKVKRKDVTPDPEPKKAVPPPQPQELFFPESDINCKVYVQGDRMKMIVSMRGQEDIVGWSRVRDVDLWQSFSYAAHMCYKLAEQRRLNDR